MVATQLSVAIALVIGLQTPAGWDAAFQRAQRLILDNKTADAIVVLEGVLKASPGFDPARYEIAEAHRMLALELALKGPSQDATKRREFELAAAAYRRVAVGTSEYKQLAVGRLLMVYGEDELNRPAEVVTFARQYVRISPGSAIGHAALAHALVATGREPAATAALLAARTAVRADDTQLLATVIVDYVLKAKTSSTTDLKALVDWADATLDRLLRDAPNDRKLLLTKAASALFRADHLETNPARKRALKAEADRAFGRFEDANPDRGGVPSAPSSSALASVPPPPPPPQPPSAMPPGFVSAMAEADNLFAAKRYTDAAAAWEKLIQATPEFPPPHYLRANALLLAGQRPAVDAALKAARTSVGAAAEARYMAATYLFDMVSSNTTIAAADAKMLLTEARVMLDDALKKNPAYWEAVVYKSLVVRAQAKYETDPAVIKTMTAEADRLRAQAEAMRRK
jgi:tetratricopeptide (TPR) repeat protein